MTGHDGAPPGDSSPPATPRWLWPVAAVLLLAHLGLAWQIRTAGVTHSNDDALYMMLGRQVEAGSYQETFRVGAPLHGQYPPVWPAMIALAQLATGDHEPAVFFVVTLLSTTAMLFVFQAARRLVSPPAALLVLAAGALNPHAIVYGGRVMSEAAYLFWSALALCGALRAREHPRYAWLAAGAALMAAMTRSIGVVLIAGILGAWLLERRWRWVGWFGLATALVLGAWFAWTVKAHEKVVGRSYIADATSQVQHLREAGRSPMVATAINAANKLREQVMGTTPAMLPLIRVNGTVVDNVVSLVLVVVLGGLGWFVLWRRGRALAIYLLGYLALLLVWPWAPRRFFIPIQPFVVLTFVLALAALEQRFRVRYRGVLAAALVASMLIAGAPVTAANLARLKDCDRAAPWTDGDCYDADQRSFFDAVVFARDSLPAEATFLVEREASFAYHTRRTVQHAQLPLAFPDSTFRRYLTEQRIGYVVVTRLTDVELERLATKLEASCRWFDLVRRFPPYGRLYRFQPEGAPAGSEACSDLRYFVETTPKRGWVR